MYRIPGILCRHHNPSSRREGVQAAISKLNNKSPDYLGLTAEHFKLGQNKTCIQTCTPTCNVKERNLKASLLIKEFVKEESSQQNITKGSTTRFFSNLKTI